MLPYHKTWFLDYRHTAIPPCCSMRDMHVMNAEYNPSYRNGVRLDKALRDPASVQPRYANSGRSISSPAIPVRDDLGIKHFSFVRLGARY
jgi:hypothetical protein